MGRRGQRERVCWGQGDHWGGSPSAARLCGSPPCLATWGLAEAAWAGCPSWVFPGEGLEEGAVLLSLPSFQGGEQGTRSLSQEGRCQGAADECEQTGDMETGRRRHFQHLCPTGALKGAYPPRREGLWVPQGA